MLHYLSVRTRAYCACSVDSTQTFNECVGVNARIGLRSWVRNLVLANFSFGTRPRPLIVRRLVGRKLFRMKQAREVEDLAYAVATLGWLPDTIMSRSVVLFACCGERRMKTYIDPEPDRWRSAGTDRGRDISGSYQARNRVGAVDHFHTGKDERPIEAFTLTVAEGAKLV